MDWLLVILVIVADSSATVDTIPMATEDHCVAAREVIVDRLDIGLSEVDAECVQTGHGG